MSTSFLEADDQWKNNVNGKFFNTYFLLLKIFLKNDFKNFLNNVKRKSEKILKCKVGICLFAGDDSDGSTLKDHETKDSGEFSHFYSLFLYYSKTVITHDGVTFNVRILGQTLYQIVTNLHIGGKSR